MASTLETIRVAVQGLFRESGNSDLIDNAINSAIQDLWQSLILVDPDTYLSAQPAIITEDEAIPFTAVSVDSFLTYWATSVCLVSVYEYEASSFWSEKAEAQRARVLQAVMVLGLVTVKNDALQDLWQSLITADSGKYLSQKPTTWSGTESELPFPELPVQPFLEFWSKSVGYMRLQDPKASEFWKSKAEDQRLQILRQVLQESRRPEYIEQFDPYATS